MKRSGSEYSEVFIRGPEMQAIGRLVLDRYSATVFSSSPDTYAAIERRMAAGASIAEAIEAVAAGAGDPERGASCISLPEPMRARLRSALAAWSPMAATCC